MNRTELFINGQPAVAGMKVITFDGEEGKLDFWGPPHKPSSTGRVYVTLDGCSSQSEFFPSVIGGEFREPNHS